MPYITQEKRLIFDPVAAEFENATVKAGVTPGDLNYVITSIIHKYMFRKGISYTHLNDVIGVLDSAKLEFYRRVVAPYEG